MRNLGDKVHNVMKATGVHQTVQAISKATGKDCGCAARQEKLNKFSNQGIFHRRHYSDIVIWIEL